MDHPQSKGMDVTAPNHDLLACLEQDHQRACRLEANARYALGLGVAAALLALLFAADALFRLSAMLRMLLGLGWVALLLANALHRRNILRTPFDPERSALRLERRGHLESDEVVNALHLARSAPPGTSEALRSESVSRGATAAHEIADHIPPSPERQLRFRRIARWTVGAVVLLAILQPRLVRDVGLRYAQPWADHPPWSRLVFTPQQQPDPTPIGHAATLRIAIAGPKLPDRAALVFPESDPPTPGPRAHTPADNREGSIVFALRLPHVDAERAYFIDTPLGRSRRYTLRASTRPVLQGAHFRVEPPSYTGWPIRQERVTSTTLNALRGSRVTLLLDANVPLGTSTLRWDTPNLHPAGERAQLLPLPGQPQRAAASWTAEASDSFQVFLAGADGEVSEVPFSARFVADPDRPPEVAIESPDLEIIAPEGWTVDIAIAASDDVRVERLELSTSTADFFHARELLLPATRANPGLAYHTHPLDLDALGAVAGTRVRYFATAYDNHPSPPQSADSAIGVIHVISREAYDEHMRQRYRMEDWVAEVSDILTTLHRLRDAKEDALKRLNELLEQATAEPERDFSAEIKATQAQLQRFQQDLESFAGALSERADLEQLYDWEAPYKDWLKETAQQIQAQNEAANAVRQALTPEQLPPSGALAEAVRAFAELTEPFGSLPADPADLEAQWQEMAEAMQALEALQQLAAVTKAQRALSDRMEAASQRPDDDPVLPDLLERLATEQYALREDLVAIQQALWEAAEPLAESQPDLARQLENLALDIRDFGIPDDQRQATDEARQRRSEPAAKHARVAAEKLEELLDRCEGACAGAGECLSGMLGLVPGSMHPSIEAALRAALTAQPGYSPGWRGTQGRGSGGFMSTVGMIGPQYPSRGQSLSMRGAQRQGLGGSSGRGGEADGGEAEAVNPEISTESFPNAPEIRTLPLRFRRHAAAYFERLGRDDQPATESEDASP